MLSNLVLLVSGICVAVLQFVRVFVGIFFYFPTKTRRYRTCYTKEYQLKRTGSGITKNSKSITCCSCDHFFGRLIIPDSKMGAMLKTLVERCQYNGT